MHALFLSTYYVSSPRGNAAYLTPPRKKWEVVRESEISCPESQKKFVKYQTKPDIYGHLAQ